jgi:hypothetical protein
MLTDMRTISRMELYDLVWKRPISLVAPELGISGPGLKKLCERHGIPVPERGYWAKLQHGKRVRRRPPLPPAKPGQREHILVQRRPAKPRLDESAMPDGLARLLATERASVEPILVPTSLKPHPIVASWPKPQKPSYGVASWSPAAEARRRKIASVLFREVEKRGGKVEAVHDEKYKWTLFGRTIEVVLRERTKKITIPADPVRPYSYERTEWHPIGLLRLRFENYLDVPIRRNWDETEARPLETRLREVLVAWFTAIEAERQRNESIEALHRKWEEDRIRHELLQEKRRKERKEADSLLADAKSWEDAARLRAFVAAVVAKDGDAVADWAAWAIGVADRMDPTLTESDDGDGADLQIIT